MCVCVSLCKCIVCVCECMRVMSVCARVHQYVGRWLPCLQGLGPVAQAAFGPQGSLEGGCWDPGSSLDARLLPGNLHLAGLLGVGDFLRTPGLHRVSRGWGVCLPLLTGAPGGGWAPSLHALSYTSGAQLYCEVSFCVEDRLIGGS